MMLMEIPVSWTRRRRPGKGSSPRSTVLFILLVITLYLISSSTVKSAPATQSPIPSSMQTYLLRFGYLPQSGFEIRDQVTESRMREAIKELQTFGNLNVTGELDKPTRELMKKPRCGVPDILSGQFRGNRRRRKRFIIQGQKWPNTNLTWSLVKSTRSHGDEDVLRELRHALNLWSSSTPLTFSLLTHEKANDADIRVNFQRGRHDDGYPFDGKGSILAHAFFPGSGQGGDAHFDDDEIWTVDSTPTREGTRLFAVAAHEFGHALGLSHSDVEGSLMYPWYQNFGYEFKLHRDDELGIQRIYGSTTRFAPNPYPPRYPFTPNPTPKPPRERPPDGRPPDGRHPVGRPNNCDSSYDAISVIRKQLFIFKGPYFWRLDDNQLLKGYPSMIRDMWGPLPSTLTHVDAVYEHNHQEIIFFIGKRYWRFYDGIHLTPGFPKSLASMGISPKVEKIDGAMIWGHNGKTYLFSGSNYWRLREEASDFRIEPDYPRDMYVWKGVPNNIDAVFKWKDDSVYFFKGKVFWKFNDRYMRVESETPTLSAPYWMGCTSHPLPPPSPDPGSTTTASSVPTPARASWLIYTLLVVHILKIGY